MQQRTDIALSAPPVAVAGATFLGYSIPEWAGIITIIYTVALLIRLIANEIRMWRK
jgi:disulfide bond formation protein DsbB